MANETFEKQAKINRRLLRRYRYDDDDDDVDKEIITKLWVLDPSV